MYALTNYHPFVLFFYFMTAVCLTMFFMHPVLLLLSLLGAFACFTWVKGVSGAGFSALFFCMVAFTNPLFSHSGITPLFFLNGNPVTLESVLYGVCMGGMLLSVLYWFKMFSIVMTTDKLLSLFAGVLPKLSLLLSMILHFVPQLVKKGKSIYAAQKAMGVCQTAKRTEKIKLWLSVLSALLTQSLEGAVDTSDSMRARGYAYARIGLPTPQTPLGRARHKRTGAHTCKFRRKDALFLLVNILLLGLFLCGALSGGAAFHFYPQMSQISVSFTSCFMYTAYGLFMLIPVIVLVKGELQWNYLRSKM